MDDGKVADGHDASFGLKRSEFFALLASTAALHVAIALFRIGSSYKAIELGYSPFWIGVMAGAYSVGPLVVAVLVSRLIEERGERLASIFAGLLLVFSSVAVVFYPSGLVVAGAVFGVGNFLSTVAQQALVTRLPSKRERDHVFGYYGIGIAVGQLVGPLLLGLAGGGEAFDPDRLFYMATGFGVLVVTTAFALPRLAAALAGTRSSSGKFRTLLRIQGLKPVLYASMVLLAANELILVYLPVVGVERGYSTELVATLLFLRAGGSIVARFFFDLASRLVDQKTLLVGLSTIAGAATVCLVADLPILVIAVLVAAAGFTLGMSMTVTMAATADHCPPGYHGALVSLRMTGNRSSQAVVPVAAGMLANALGPASVFAVAGAAVLSAALSVGLSRRRGAT